MPDYGRADYWDERYRANDTTFDWFVSLEPLKDLLLSHLKSHHRVLVLGCGNSRLSPSLYDHDIQHIVNVDISEVVITQMRSRYREMERMEWHCMDVLRLDFPDASFDAVIDKGLIDSLLCGSNSFHNVYVMNKQVSRVLKKGGRYISITYGQPDTRMDHYQRKRLRFECEHRTIDKPIFGGGGGGGGFNINNINNTTPSSAYHVYVMVKTEDSSSSSSHNTSSNSGGGGGGTTLSGRGGGGYDHEDLLDEEEDDDFYDKFQANVVS